MSSQKGELRMDKCRVCGGRLPDGRQDRETDTDKCRKKLYRQRAAKRRKVQEIMNALPVIREMLFDAFLYDEALQALLAIRDTASATYDRGLRQKDLAK